MATPIATVTRSANSPDEPSQTSGLEGNNVAESPNSSPRISQNDRDDVSKLMDESGVFDIAPAVAKSEPKVEPAKAETPAPVEPTAPAAETPKEAPADPSKAEQLATPPTTPPAAVEPQAGSDKEIDSIEMPRNMSPKNQENWKRLRDVATREKVLRNEAETKAKQTEEKYKDFSTKFGDVSKLDTELKELRDMRRSLDIANDPEFKTRFDDTVNNNYKELEGILTAHGLSKETMEAIQKAGGLEAHALAFGAEKGKDWWEEEVIKPLIETGDPNDKRAALVIRKKLDQNEQLKYEKQLEIKKASESKSEFFVRKEQQKLQQTQAMQKEIIDEVAEVQKLFPMLKMQDVPAGATPEQKAQIEQANANYKNIESTFKAALFPSDNKTKVQVAASAVLAQIQDPIIKNLKSEIERKDAELARLRGATALPSGNAAPPIAAVKKSNGDRTAMKALDAIELGMQEAGA